MEIRNCLFSHQFDVPFFSWGMAPISFAVTSQVPLFYDFPLTKREVLKYFRMKHYMLSSTEHAMTHLLSLFLRLAAAPSADRCSFSAFTHNACNVMRGRRLSLRHSVKHYKASGMKYRLFIYLNLKVAYNFVNILVGHICDFLFVVDSKQIDASICCSYDHIQCDNPKASPLPPSFAFNTKTDFAFAASKRDTSFRIIHQFKLKSVNIIGKRAIMLCQSLCLTKKFFSIVECYHILLCFCSKFLNQSIKRCKSFTCETSFLGFTITPCYGLANKSFLRIDVGLCSNQFINGYSFDCSQNMFQTGNKACVFNVQNNLCHNTIL